MAGPTLTLLLDAILRLCPIAGVASAPRLSQPHCATNPDPGAASVDLDRVDGAIGANHRRYVAMDACLRCSPRSIRCRFFAAAAAVTHPRGGLGVLDGAVGRLVFTAEESAFLHHVHRVLARMNRAWFARLRLGREVPGCEGLRGRALDHALVDLEQRRFSLAMHRYFKGDAARRMRLISGINDVLQRNPFLRSPLLARPLRAALAAARERRCIDLGDEAQRRAIGHALVDLLGMEGSLVGRGLP